MKKLILSSIIALSLIGCGPSIPEGSHAQRMRWDTSLETQIETAKPVNVEQLVIVGHEKVDRNDLFILKDVKTGQRYLFVSSNRYDVTITPMYPLVQ